jgi:hypothetical protein
LENRIKAVEILIMALALNSFAFAYLIITRVTGVGVVVV